MQTYYNRERKKGKHLTLVERCIIEANLKEEKTHKEIAERIGVSTKTIQREVKRGTVELLNSDLTVKKEYVAEFANQKYRDKQKAKEGILKIGSMQKLANDIEKLIIKEKYSPFAALEVLKKKYEIPFGWRTLYNYIYKKIFLKLRKKHLPYNKKYERHEEVEKRIKKNGGRSIEERSERIETREELGHWEMDTVVGKKGSKACLLVLTERVSRKEIILKLPEKKSSCVVDGLKQIRERFKKSFCKRFKSITSDNGSEFMDSKSIEEMGIAYFYAHSYCSYERGSNENNNRFIRRFIRKGTDIGKCSKAYIKKIEKYINAYPRKQFCGKSADEVYKELFA